MEGFIKENYMDSTVLAECFLRLLLVKSCGEVCLPTVSGLLNGLLLGLLVRGIAIIHFFLLQYLFCNETFSFINEEFQLTGLQILSSEIC